MALSRRQARRAALNVLFQADVSGEDPVQVLTDVDELEGPLDAFTGALVTGVAQHVAEVDALIAQHAEGWSVARLGALERSILRLAGYELCFVDEIPEGVAIDEAVEAARELGTPEAARFVNGVLGGIARA